MQYKSSEDSEQQTAQAKENASKKKHFHHLGQGGYKAAIPKWQKMEEDLIARGILPATFNWPLRARYYFYAHGGTLNMEDGSFVTSDAIREATDSSRCGTKGHVLRQLQVGQRERRAVVRSWHTGTHRTCARNERSSMEA